MHDIKTISFFLFLFFCQRTYGEGKPEFNFGLGLGGNLAQVQVADYYDLYENLPGAEYTTSYSSLPMNIGTQIYFHADFQFDNNMVVSLKPGVYSYSFYQEQIFQYTEGEEIKQVDFLLRYVGIPLEFKYLIADNNLKPFVGGVFHYAYLLNQKGSDTKTFLNNSLSLGLLAGAYYSFTDFQLVFTAGYNTGLHIITDRDSRYNLQNGTAYSQSDLKLGDIHVGISLLFQTGRGNKKKSFECVYPKKRR